MDLLLKKNNLCTMCTIGIFQKGVLETKVERLKIDQENTSKGMASHLHYTTPLSKSGFCLQTYKLK